MNNNINLNTNEQVVVTAPAMLLTGQHSAQKGNLTLTTKRLIFTHNTQNTIIKIQLFAIRTLKLHKAFFIFNVGLRISTAQQTHVIKVMYSKDWARILQKMLLENRRI